MNRVLLNNVEHGDLRVDARHGAELGDNINQVLIFPTEFEDVQREYPIFLRKDANGDYQAVALLGLDRDENLFLDATGWRARYVPAVQQRGPFSIALQERPGAAPEPMIHIDLDHPRVGRTDGEPLFLPEGGNAPYLKHVSRVLGVIYDGLEVGKPLYAALEDLSLIEPVAVEIKLSDREAYDLPDVYTIAHDRLMALQGPDLERLHQSGLLRAAYAVLSSMGNVARLIELKNRKLAQA